MGRVVVLCEVRLESRIMVFEVGWGFVLLEGDSYRVNVCTT